MANDAPIDFSVHWPIVRLGDISLKIGSGATPRGGEETYLPTRDRFALVRSQNVFDRRFDSSGLAYISDEQARRLQGVAIQPGDLLLNITGDGVTFARSCAVPSAVLPACVNQHVSIIRVDPAVAEPGYVLAYLTHPRIKSYIESFNAGGSRRAITKGHIESFRLALPPLSEQRAIAHILGALDDKIELNRQMNQALERIAAALFKSWFVDFDPVRAKAAGRQPEGMNAETAALFPDRLVESDIGEIPEGWAIGAVGGLAEVVDCLHSKKPSRTATGRPLLQLSNIRDDGLLDMTDTYFITDEDYKRWTSRIEVRQGDCVITNVGRVGAVAQIPYGFLAAIGRNMTGIRPRSTFPYPTWLLQLLISDWMKQEVSNRTDSGTILDALNVRSIPLLRLVLSDERIVQKFENIAYPMRRRMELNLSEGRTLAEIRDTLLPRLLSGELRVPLDELDEEAVPMPSLSEKLLVQSHF